MSQTDLTREEIRAMIDDDLGDVVDVYPRELGGEEEAFVDFIEGALGEVRDMLAVNHSQATGMGLGTDDEDRDAVAEVLDPENVREVAWYAPQFKGNRVTVWLRDCPVWANDAQVRTFYVTGGLNARDGKVTATLDVRPF